MTRHELLVPLVFSALAGAGCPDSGADEESGSESTATEDPTGSSTSIDPSTSSGGSTTTTGDTDTDPSDTDGTETSTSESETETGTPAMCTEARLWAGNPFYDGEFEGWNPDGHPLLADPPLRSRQMTTMGDRVAISTQFEIWLADDTQSVRLAGLEGLTPGQYQPAGTCADARFVIIEGITGLPNGNLVVADIQSHGLVELADPMGACMAMPFAGNATAGIESEASEMYGDVDGPGLDARFARPTLPVADADNNVYVVDLDNHKIKRVAYDADRTVTTLATLDAGFIPFAMTELGGVLYIVGSDGSNDIFTTVDTAGPGEPTVVFSERGRFPEFDTSIVAQLAGIAHDGTDLFVASAKGYVWRMSTSGEPLATIAGTGNIADIPEDIDYAQPIPLDMLPLRTYSTARNILTARGSDFLYAGSDGGRGYHIWSIDCG